MSTLSGRLGEVLSTAVGEGAVPGAVAVVASPTGLVDVVAAGSTRCDDAGVGLHVDALFRLASMTKAFTSVAALQLVGRGQLGLDDPVVSVLPEWGDLKVLDGFDGDRPRLRDPSTQATVRHLLTHTAGHGYFFFNADLGRYHELTGTPTVVTGLRASLHAPLQSDPGTRWEYGISTDWLGLVVERITGRPLDEHLAGELFEPLGMTATTFRPTSAQRAEMMPVHVRTTDGGLSVSDIALSREPEWMAGGHGAAGTAADYGRFISMLLARGESPKGRRILPSELVDLAFTDQLGALSYPAAIETAAPALSNRVVHPPVRQSWGLGFHITLEDLPGLRRAGSGDWSGLFNCYYWIDPASGVGGAFLTQLLPHFDEACVAAATRVEAAVYDDVRTTSSG